MYDDERLRMWLTGDVRLLRARSGWIALFPINGVSGRFELPDGLVPRGTPRSIPPGHTLSRVIFGLMSEAERHVVVERPWDETDLWVVADD